MLEAAEVCARKRTEKRRMGGPPVCLTAALAHYGNKSLKYSDLQGESSLT